MSMGKTRKCQSCSRSKPIEQMDYAGNLHEERGRYLRDVYMCHKCLDEQVAINAVISAGNSKRGREMMKMLNG